MTLARWPMLSHLHPMVHIMWALVCFTPAILVTLEEAESPVRQMDSGIKNQPVPACTHPEVCILCVLRPTCSYGTGVYVAVLKVRSCRPEPWLEIIKSKSSMSSKLNFHLKQFQTIAHRDMKYFGFCNIKPSFINCKQNQSHLDRSWYHPFIFVFW